MDRSATESFLRIRRRSKHLLSASCTLMPPIMTRHVPEIFWLYSFAYAKYTVAVLFDSQAACTRCAQHSVLNGSELRAPFLASFDRARSRS